MSTQPRLKLKSINQVGFVVKDLDQAMKAYWENFGIGPWKIWTYGSPLVKDTTFRGRPEDFHMRIAIAMVGDVMIELIQHLDGHSVYKEYAQRAGQGVQHLGVFVDSIAEAVKEAEAAGFKVIQSGRGYGATGDGGFAYLDTEDELGTIFEFIEIPKVRRPPERIYPEQ